MKIKHKFTFVLLTTIAVLLFAVLYSYGVDSIMLNPKGIIGLKERHIMATAMFLMLLVVIPVFLLLFFICWRYREGNKEAAYTPDWDDNATAEFIWWGFPFVIIVILSVVTWISSYDLDPYKPLDSKVKPLHIQVVALDWKWLFLYPEEKIATVNYFKFPVGTPLSFEITAQAPMNSFWIPQLGGQIYAMPGMSTKLHLIADEKGSYRGSSANLSGQGFAGMTFTAQAVSEKDYAEWVQSVKKNSSTLDLAEYKGLVKPSMYDPEASYLLGDATLYDQIVMKYMMPETVDEAEK